MNGEIGEDQAERASNGGKQQGFAELLADETPPAAAEGRADCDFLAARGSASNQQVGNVEAGNQQDATGCRQQHVECERESNAPVLLRVIVVKCWHEYWRVTIDNPPINVMGPEMVQEFQEVIDALEADEHVRVVVFDSAVEGYFLNHSDFTAKLEDLTSLPDGPTGLPPWPDFLVRLTRLPVASIALIRGRATGNGSEITLACDMSFASREKAILSQWEVGVGMVAGGGPMARLPQLIGRNRALEVLLSSKDIRGEQAEAYGYVNRALPDAELDAFVEALATRIAKFDKWAIANTKRLVNTSLRPDVELDAGWDACIASLGGPAAQNGIKELMAQASTSRGTSKIGSDTT